MLDYIVMQMRKVNREKAIECRRAKTKEHTQPRATQSINQNLKAWSAGNRLQMSHDI